MRAHYVAEGKVQTTEELDVILSLIAKGIHVWVILASKEKTPEKLFETLTVHPLTVEDVWNENGTPKVEEFDNYLYVRSYGIRESSKEELVQCELDLVLGKNFLLSHDGASVLGDLEQEYVRNPKLLTKGVGYIAHAMLDTLVDRFLPVVDYFDKTVEALENEVMSKAGTPGGQSVLERLFELKRELQSFRRSAAQQREIFLRLGRGEYEEIPKELVPFFRDIYDHFMRMIDLVESYREMASNSLDIFLSVQANRMNEVMKTLTLMSTIMLPLSFIAGVYGMNFKRMPELEWHNGYEFALFLMAAVAVTILVWFKRKRWIGS